MLQLSATIGISSLTRLRWQQFKTYGMPSVLSPGLRDRSQIKFKPFVGKNIVLHLSKTKDLFLVFLLFDFFCIFFFFNVRNKENERNGSKI